MPPPEAPIPESTGATPTPPPEVPVPEATGATPTPPPEAPMPPPAQGPPAAKPAPPPAGAKLRLPEPSQGKATASGPQPLVLHTGRIVVVAGEKDTGLLGRITELKREGRELGHFLGYAEKWNQADISTATRGVGKDRLPIVDPAGPKSTEEHFMRLRRAVKEFDNAWHDATNNVVSTADVRKQLFEELLWEHRDLAEAHSHCQAIPEASIEALKSQLSELHAEKEQLLQKHKEALDAQKDISRQLKEQAIQAGLRHEEEMKEAKAAAEAKLAEVLEESANANAVLLAELEEERKERKAVEHRMELMTTHRKEYDRLLMQIDALARQHFPDSQTHAVKKVMDDRVAREFPNMDAHWDGYDYLVALSARVQHMRSVDRSLADLPDVAIQICKVMWPGEAIPANVTVTANRLRDAGRRIREWQCSAARAGADTALRSRAPGTRTWIWMLFRVCVKTLPPIRIRFSPRSGRIVPIGLLSTRRFAPSSPLPKASRTTSAMRKKRRKMKMKVPVTVTPLRKIQRPVTLLQKPLLFKHLA
ncbi:hypothetical protein QYE76_011202 [Lolium multiflorum]|uniref:Uncharacterized protein n=1 Tax=Lolium multiflorum TaxID=4521 RepID=A0AAD8X3T8_LOLMU|nr:hypothetical protein QYE76_011202 [Lolium multiflorum]